MRQHWGRNRAKLAPNPGNSQRNSQRHIPKSPVFRANMGISGRVSPNTVIESWPGLQAKTTGFAHISTLGTATIPNAIPNGYEAPTPASRALDRAIITSMGGIVGYSRRTSATIARNRPNSSVRRR